MNNETGQMFILNAGVRQPPLASQKLLETPGATQVNLENVEDFSNVCRACATITEFVIPIFAGEGLQNSLADKIHKHLPIRVSETDDLPHVLCYQCASTLLAWHELVKCSVQADQALRAKLAVDSEKANKDTKQTILKPNSTVEGDSLSKFKNIADYAVHPMAPPTAPSAPPQAQPRSRHPQQEPLPPRQLPPALPAPQEPSLALPASQEPSMALIAPQEPQLALPAPVEAPLALPAPQEPQLAYPVPQDALLAFPAPQELPPESPKDSPSFRLCNFCGTKHSEANYDQHVVATHSKSVFFCEECNEYIDKIKLYMHMSLHAMELGESRKKGTAGNEEDQNDLNQNIDSTASETPKSQLVPEARDPKPSKNNQDNEFSDHSDMEYGFGPLPESVFEAIEDTQDTQQAASTSHMSENENHGDESNEETPPAASSVKSRKRARACPICSKEYKASSSFFYHMKHTHKRVKEHECAICAKQFGTRASLAVHVTTHTGESPFECRECNKRFRSNASLYIHEQTHNDIRMWSCTQCCRSFRWKTHLIRHMQRHAAEKTHICTICSRGFSVKSDLLRHARTHIAGNFVCSKCDITFAQFRYLKVHSEKKHGIKIVKKSK